jgi:hypothetical protein
VMTTVELTYASARFTTSGRIFNSDKTEAARVGVSAYELVRAVLESPLAGVCRRPRLDSARRHSQETWPNAI